MRISDGARKHQIADEDMLHALRNVTRHSDEEDGFTMLVGPARNGQLLEIGILDIDGDDPVIIHAMMARSEHLS